jgi:glycosyltransferase involved in cell wall biosynthesis
MLAKTIGWPAPDDELAHTGVEMERTCVRLADRVYSSSACSAAWCAQLYGLDESTTPILHLGVDCARFVPAARQSDAAPTVVFVGKLTRTKGVELLVDAMLALAPEHPQVRLRLIGRDEGQIVASLHERAATAGFPDLLDVRGHVHAEDMPAALSGCTLFAAPSLYEGGPGLVYLEAMACGLPVVAASGGGVTEVVRDGENGLLVPPGDTGALTDALRQLLTNRDAAAAMGRRAREWVVAEADSERCVDRLEALFEDAVAGVPWTR